MFLGAVNKRLLCVENIQFQLNVAGQWPRRILIKTVYFSINQMNAISKNSPV